MRPLLNLSLLAVLLNGCVLSVEPVVPESDALFDERLIGTWATTPSEFAKVSRAGGSDYAIEYTVGGESGLLAARLGTLGGRLVLDVWPEPRDGDLPKPYEDLMVAGHAVLSIEIEADTIKITVMEPDSLQAAIDDHRVPLRHTKSKDGQLILLGSTEELRRNLGAHFSDSAAWDDPTVWHRVESIEIPPERPGNGALCFDASAWPSADSLFHRDPHWLGADGASSVDLGNGRILWLFGDTWIDPTGSGTRHGAEMVSNTVAIQTGPNPDDAEISFHWGRTVDGQPEAFFRDEEGESLWPGHGIRLDDRLVIFFARTIRDPQAPLGFRNPGWTAVMIENPDTDPAAWRVRSLQTPKNPLGILVGFAAAFQTDEHAYALGSQDPVKTHPVFAARWKIEDFRRGDLLNPEWWAGDAEGWVPDASDTPRWPILENGSSEMSVHVDAPTGRFVAIQTEGFGPADVMLREAPSLTGPWSAARFIYRAAEYDRGGILIYAGKAHPELSGADLVVTYATNTRRIAEQLEDPLTYYPHFVRLTRCEDE